MARCAESSSLISNGLLVAGGGHTHRSEEEGGGISLNLAGPDWAVGNLVKFASVQWQVRDEKPEETPLKAA